MELRAEEIPSAIKNLYVANHPFLWIVSPESYRVQTAIQEGTKLLNARPDIKAQDVVQVLCHDKLCGFYANTPGIIPPADKTNLLLNGLICTLGDRDTIQRSGIKADFDKDAKEGGFPFDPRQNLIFVMKDCDFELNQSPLCVQMIRDAIQANMCSPRYYWDRSREASTRGKRMIILVTPNENLPKGLPEVKPIYIALPDMKTLGRAWDNVVLPLVKAHGSTKGAKGMPAVADEDRGKILKALSGGPYLFAEDTLSLCAAEHGTFNDMQAVLKTIEREKSKYIAGYPGLYFMPRERILKMPALAGYDVAEEFIRDRMAITPEVAEAHDLQPLKGVTLVGIPGTGKTQFALKMAALTNRMLLIWSLGESQGSLVGESEANTRKVIQIAQAMEAVVLLDDVDKAGISVATGGSQTSIEGGPFGRMIQMLLTEMSSDDNKAIWVFTCNRVKNIPGELIRPGRMDERFYAVRPDDAETKAQILRNHFEKKRFPVEGKEAETRVMLIASDLTNYWTGSELADLVKKAAIRAIGAGAKKIDWNWACKEARATKPMATQKAYKDDFDEMELMCQDFKKIGSVKATRIEAQGEGRAARDIE